MQALENATERMNEMKLVMRKAISMDEDAISREEELISRLCTENKVSFPWYYARMYLYFFKSKLPILN